MTNLASFLVVTIVAFFAISLLVFSQYDAQEDVTGMARKVAEFSYKDTTASFSKQSASETKEKSTYSLVHDSLHDSLDHMGEHTHEEQYKDFLANKPGYTELEYTQRLGAKKQESKKTISPESCNTASDQFALACKKGTAQELIVEHCSGILSVTPQDIERVCTLVRQAS